MPDGSLQLDRMLASTRSEAQALAQFALADWSGPPPRFGARHASGFTAMNIWFLRWAVKQPGSWTLDEARTGGVYWDAKLAGFRGCKLSKFIERTTCSKSPGGFWVERWAISERGRDVLKRADEAEARAAIESAQFAASDALQGGR